MTIDCTVAVTGMNATDNPAPGTGVIRSLRAHPAWRGRIVGLAYDALDTAAYDPELVDEVHLLPYPGAGANNVLLRLREICARTPIDVLVPTLDSEMANFVALAPELAELGIKVLLPDAKGLRLRSKLELYEFCSSHGITSPPTAMMTSPAQVRRLELDYPLAIKGMFHGAHKVTNADEASTAFERIRNRWGLPVLAQKLVDGDEYDVIMLGDRQGKAVGMVCMRKLGMTDQGKAWSGVTVCDPQLEAVAKRIFEALAWTGPLELEFVRDRQRGDYHLIEINPRFPSWCYLSVGAGQNLPLATVMLALGMPLEPLPPARPGVTFVRHAVDLVCSLEALQSLVISGSLVHHPRSDGLPVPAEVPSPTTVDYQAGA